MQNQKARSLITACAKYAGISDPLQDDDYTFIMQMLKNQFSHWTLTDVGKAFETYAANKLGDFEHYGTFSPKFFGRVLKSYKEYRAKQNTIKPIEPARQIEMKQESEEERQIRAYEFIKECVENNEEIYTANWTDAFRYCEKMGYIKMSDQEKREYFKKVKQDIESQIKNKATDIRSIKRLIELQASPRATQIECRKRLLIDYFKTQ